MARFTLCFILFAAALGHAIQPPDAPGKSVSPSSVAALDSQVADSWNWQLSPATTASRNDMPLAADNDDICYKIRAYIFKRDDDHVPLYVRSTTCGPRQPRQKNAVWPKARLVPAN
jgi:hypothetical protein